MFKSTLEHYSCRSNISVDASFVEKLTQHYKISSVTAVSNETVDGQIRSDMSEMKLLILCTLIDTGSFRSDVMSTTGTIINNWLWNK